MSKKRFVEFYLSAMLKAATNGRVTRVAYLYYDLSLLGIAATVIDCLKGWPLE